MKRKSTKLSLCTETVRHLQSTQLGEARGGVWTDTATDGMTGCKSENTGCISWRCTAVQCVTPLCVSP